ncbi:MAG TPA: glycosyltransferase [Candidatus Ozemobacteraceae bacterium]|nr:glycosyltransferase [Candidatus Ozemobacteraceae bacterium]HQG27796.1 glycosyltransferase [Candidatus Ozemobacteraceae bacterium]
MWLLEFSFYLVTGIIVWMMFGYFILLRVMGILKGFTPPAIPENLPHITVIVPCYNEEGGIAEKLANIRELAYPPEKLEVLFVDGGSKDRTVALLEEAISPSEPFTVLRSPRGGKINQLNFALSQAKGEIIFNTDADAMMEKDCLRWCIAEFARGPDVLVVGAYCSPHPQALEMEKYHWISQNKGRFLESDACCSSIVVAPCYAFRRSLVTSFPDDVIADDIYVAYMGHASGGRTIFSHHARVQEIRVPTDQGMFIAHKFRKSNAFLRESLRFLHRLPDMGMFCKTMFITRIGQQLFLPALLIWWFLIAGALLSLSSFVPLILGVTCILLTFVITSFVFSTVPLPEEAAKSSITTMVKGYIISLSILLAMAVSYPFYRQTSSYARIGDAVK